MTKRRPARTDGGVLGAIVVSFLCEVLLEAIAQPAFEAPGPVPVLGIFLVWLAVNIWAWKKVFPGRPKAPKSRRAERVVAVPPSETPSYLWDREIDGP